MPTNSKSIIIASLVLPLFLVACNRADNSPTSGPGASQEKMSSNPSMPPADQPTGKSPPSPSDLSSNPAAPPSSAPSTSESAPADQKIEPKKDN